MARLGTVCLSISTQVVFFCGASVKLLLFTLLNLTRNPARLLLPLDVFGNCRRRQSEDDG